MEKAESLTKTFTILILVFLTSCNSNSDNYKKGWKTIEIGSYQFDFPSNFNLIEEQGIDSYVGKIIGDSLKFAFDFGYYSNSLTESPQEYLDKGYWIKEAAYQFMEPGVTYDNNNFPKIHVLKIKTTNPNDNTLDKGVAYIATCKYAEKEFEFPIYLPDEIEKHRFKIDTLNGHFRKVIIANNPADGLTGIYIKDLGSHNESINSSLALSMTTRDLTKKQQKLVLKIFESGRPKKAE